MKLIFLSSRFNEFLGDGKRNLFACEHLLFKISMKMYNSWQFSNIFLMISKKIPVEIVLLLSKEFSEILRNIIKIISFWIFLAKQRKGESRISNLEFKIRDSLFLVCEYPFKARDYFLIALRVSENFKEKKIN